MATLPILPTIRIREKFTPTLRRESDTGSSQSSVGPSLRVKVLNLGISSISLGNPIGLLMSLTYSSSFGSPFSSDIPTVRII